MNTWQIIVAVVVALLGYPVGLIISWLADDELEQGRKWFEIIIISSIMGIVLSIIFAKAETLWFLLASFLFITLVALASVVESKRKKKGR